MHIITLLEKKFENNDYKNKYQAKALGKINRNIQGRIFDDFTLWDEADIKDLCNEYKEIHDAILIEARKNPSFKKNETVDSKSLSGGTFQIGKICLAS